MIQFIDKKSLFNLFIFFLFLVQSLFEIKFTPRYVKIEPKVNCLQHFKIYTQKIILHRP